jgi:hypothetical protein
MKTPDFTEWFGPEWSSRSKTQTPSWLTATEQTSVLVSMCKIHDMMMFFLIKICKNTHFSSEIRTFAEI